MDFIQIPKHVFMSKEISHGAALLYGAAYLASYSEGRSYRSNASYAEEFGCNTRTITRWVKELADAGFIRVVEIYKPNSVIVDKRYITPLVTLKSTIDKNVPQESLTVDKNIPNGRQKCSATVDKNSQGNIQGNIQVNIQDNIQDNIQGETSSPKEVISKNSYNFLGRSYLKGEIPTVEQVIEFYKITGNGLNCKSNALYFHAYWTERDWKRGSKKVQWPKTLNTWIASSKARGK